MGISLNGGRFLAFVDPAEPRWNWPNSERIQNITGKRVGFAFARVASGCFFVTVLYEHAALAALQQTTGLVEDGEFQAIVRHAE